MQCIRKDVTRNIVRSSLVGILYAGRLVDANVTLCTHVPQRTAVPIVVTGSSGLPVVGAQACSDLIDPMNPRAAYFHFT